MDKADFIQKAPIYYAAGIAKMLRDNYASGKMVSIEDLDGVLSALDGSDYFVHRPLVRSGTAILVSAGVVRAVEDDFGPTLYQAQQSLTEWMNDEAPHLYPIFHKISAIGNSWLKTALQKVNETYEGLEIADDDFPTIQPSEWEPLPLDRKNADFDAASKALDKAIDAIEGDNGYAVHAPGEREVVLSQLKAFQKLIRETSQIYWMQVRQFALEPLARVASRLGEGATGIAASAAKAAITDWLKNNFTKLFTWLGG